MTSIYGDRAFPVADLQESLIRTSHYQKVKVHKLSNAGMPIGHSVWIDRSGGKLKAKYLAFKDSYRGQSRSVYQRLQDWKLGRKLVMVCSGAFSTELPNGFNQNATPVGLTVDNGKIVNRRIESSMDGLVIVYATGGIVVSDIENKNLRIGNQRISVKDDKVQLINWAIQENATIFQTQLLAYDNNLRISRAGRKHKRERRILALVQSPRTRQVAHVIFDIPEYHYLFDVSRDVFYYLRQEKQLDVVALLNLDTGAYNVLELYDDQGRRDQEVAGVTDIKASTNLIVYYQ